MSDNFLPFTTPETIEALCGKFAAANAPQLPLLRAALDFGIAVSMITSPAVPWPAKLIDKADRPVCVLVCGDPGYGEPDPAPKEWAAARRLKYWCRAAIVHGTGGTPDDYRQAALATVAVQRLAFIETTSARAVEWAEFLKCPRTLLLVPPDGVHPVPPKAGSIH